MGPTLSVLGVKLVMVEDAEALERYGQQVEARNPRRWLERLRNVIHDEEMANRRGENWSIAKDYVRSLLPQMSEAVGSQSFQREDETSV